MNPLAVKSMFGRLPLLDPLLRVRPPLPTLRLPFRISSPVPLPELVFPALRVSDPAEPVVTLSTVRLPPLALVIETLPLDVILPVEVIATDDPDALVAVKAP